MAQRINLIRLT